MSLANDEGSRVLRGAKTVVGLSLLSLGWSAHPNEAARIPGFRAQLLPSAWRAGGSVGSTYACFLYIRRFFLLVHLPSPRAPPTTGARTYISRHGRGCKQMTKQMVCTGGGDIEVEVGMEPMSRIGQGSKERIEARRRSGSSSNPCRTPHEL